MGDILLIVTSGYIGSHIGVTSEGQELLVALKKFIVKTTAQQWPGGQETGASKKGAQISWRDHDSGESNF